MWYQNFKTTNSYEFTNGIKIMRPKSYKDGERQWRMGCAVSLSRGEGCPKWSLVWKMLALFGIVLETFWSKCISRFLIKVSCKWFWNKFVLHKIKKKKKENKISFSVFVKKWEYKIKVVFG